MLNNKHIPKILSYFIPVVFILICGYYPAEENSLDYQPILMERYELEQSISFETSRNLVKPGKIYIKENYIYISEKYKGVHIIDNTYPTDPSNIGFIRIPGCLDMAIKGNYLYVDNAVDLITIDLSELPTMVVTKRIQDIFPELLPPGFDHIPGIYKKENRPKNTVIVEWLKI